MNLGRRRSTTAAVVAVAVAGCSGSAGGSPAPGTGSAAGSTAGGALTGTVTVFAAASLSDVFPALGEDLRAEHPRLDVQFSFAGSSSLAAQLEQGAPADVFASADEVQMARVTDAGLAEDPRVFARNVLAIAVPPDDPGDVSGLPDFARAELDVAVCAPEVPCGAAARELFDALGIDARPDTYEEDVRAVLAKVQLGEVDAGLVWATDVVAAGDTIRSVATPESAIAETRYPIAALPDAPNPAAARAFVDLVLSPDGQAALSRAGFLDR